VMAEAFDAFERTGYTFTKALAYLILALIEYRRVPVDVITMIRHVDEAERWFSVWEMQAVLGACKLIYGVVARLTGSPEQALELFEEGYRLMVECRYEWGIATARYFAAEAMLDLGETDPRRVPEAIALLNESLTLYWEQGDSWGAGGSMSCLACILAQVGEDVQAATYFGVSGSLMQRVGASLLPTELMTHEEAAAKLRERMGASRYDVAYQQGATSLEETVNQAIVIFGQYDRGGPGQAPTPARLTNRQLAVVRDLASGLDIPGVARRRGRTQSATYELVGRICERLGVDTWEDIVPYAEKHSLIPSPGPKSAGSFANRAVFPENP